MKQLQEGHGDLEGHLESSDTGRKASYQYGNCNSAHVTIINIKSVSWLKSSWIFQNHENHEIITPRKFALYGIAGDNIHREPTTIIQAPWSPSLGW